jgi:hypothetical protein
MSTFLKHQQCLALAKIASAQKRNLAQCANLGVRDSHVARGESFLNGGEAVLILYDMELVLLYTGLHQISIFILPFTP